MITFFQNHMVKAYSIGIAVCLLFLASVYAAPVKFDITVSPNPLKAGEFADVTVKALDSNGDVDPSYTDGDIWIQIDGVKYTDPDVVLPGGGIGLFEPADQGVKVFSKGLTIKRPGTYTLSIADVYDTTLMGSVEIEVLADGNTAAKSDVQVISPVADSVEKDATVEVIGTTTFANTPLEIFIDGVSLQEAISDANKNFTMLLSGLAPGEHTLKINALDLEDKVVGTSGDIPFTYEPDTSELYLGLEVSPTTTVKVDEKVTITISTAERVQSAFVRFGSGEYLPTQKVKAGEFEKQIAMSSAGEYPIDVKLSVDGNETEYPDEEVLTVIADTKRILTLDYTTNDERTKADLTWTYTGTIDYFKIMYGTDKNALRLSVSTVTPSGMLVLADPFIPYYAQVLPVDEQGEQIGEPSSVITIAPLQRPQPVCGDGKREGDEQCDDGNLRNGDGCNASCMIEQATQQPVCGDGKREGDEQCDDGNIRNGDGCSASCTIETNAPTPTLPPVQPSCNPGGIELKSEKIGDTYFIKRQPVPRAKEYIVYRSDQAVASTAQMTIVGRTQQTMFEYPFDPMSEVDKWAWYAVEAVCIDDTQKQVGDLTAVKVGPEKTLLVIFLVSVIGFLGWRMTKTTS